jgi:hypothetical protein
MPQVTVRLVFTAVGLSIKFAVHAIFWRLAPGDAPTYWCSHGPYALLVEGKELVFYTASTGSAC